MLKEPLICEVAPLADLAPARSTRTDALLARWLGFVKAHLVTLHLLVAGALTGIADVLISLTRAHLPSAVESLPLEIGVVLVSLAVPVVVTAVALRREFRAMLKVINDGPPAAAPILLRFVTEELAFLQEQVDDLRTQGALLDAEHVSDWVRRRCFEVTHGRYIAADSSIPSDFLKRYRNFLTAHADYIRRTNCEDSVRINVAPTDSLITDSKNNPDRFKEYIQWHQDHGVVLLHFDRVTALNVARRHNLGTTIDWSYWVGELALSWEYEQVGVRMRLIFVGESTYRRAHDFLRDILEDAEAFDAVQSVLN